MYGVVLEVLLLVSPGAKKMPIENGQRVKIHKTKKIGLMPYSSDVKPSFWYLLKNTKEFDEHTLRSFLHTEGVKKIKKAKISPIKDRKNAFKREHVSYAEILANLKTMAEWKKTQNDIREGKVKNIQMAKLNMEERIRRMRLEFVKTHGTPKEYEEELEAYRAFERFKNRFLLGKEVEK